MKANILAIDDNPVVATMLAITLKASGHRVTSVFSGSDAIRRLQSDVFDLVLLDLHLPDYSGFEILEVILRRRLCEATPIVVVSASDDAYDISHARMLGAAGYFAKIVSLETLPAKIDRLLTGQNVTWIDDYHCVTDAQAPTLQDSLVDPLSRRAANDGSDSEVVSIGSIRSALAARPRPAGRKLRRASAR